MTDHDLKNLRYDAQQARILANMLQADAIAALAAKERADDAAEDADKLAEIAIDEAEAAEARVRAAEAEMRKEGARAEA